MITKVEVFSSQPGAPELPLAGFAASSDPVHVRDIQGLGPVKAEIQSTQLASGRGKQYQGSTVGERNIVMALGLNPDWADQTMSTLRQYLYAYFMTEEWVKLRFHMDHLPTCDIEGYVESFEPNMFSQDPEIQISILCHKPDFVGVDASVFTGLVDDGANEHVIDYSGSIPTGFEIRVDRSVANPSFTGLLTIELTQPDLTIQSFSVDPVTIDTLKYFKFSSVRHLKRVSTVAYADGAATNKLSEMVAGSVWPVLKPGENLLRVFAEENDQAWTLAFFNRFGGL